MSEGRKSRVNPPPGVRERLAARKRGRGPRRKPPGSQNSDERNELEVAPLTQAEFDSDKAPNWIIKGMLHEGSSHNLTGATKVGKSWFAYQLAMCVATKTRFLEFPTRKRKVLIASMEMSAALVRERMQAIKRDIKIPMPRYGRDYEVVAPTLGNPIHGLQLTHERGREQFRKLVRATDAKLVILDTLYRFTVGADPLSNETMGEVFTQITELARETGAAFLLLDHVAKGEHNGPVAHSALGAQAKGGASQSIIGLQRKSRSDGGKWEVDLESHYGSWDHPTYYERPQLSDGSRGMGCVRTDALGAHGLSREDLRALFVDYGEREAGLARFSSKKKLTEALKSAKLTNSNQTASRIVKAIERDWAQAEGNETGWESRPVATSPGPRKAVIFTWKGPVEAESD